MAIVELLFWSSIALILYCYLFYPVVLLMVSALYQLRRDVTFLFAKRERRVAGEETIIPDVAVVIAAYNEEKDIGDRVKNLLSQDYPADKVKIYIGSDGSSDRTVDILNGFCDDRLQIFPFEENRGKISVLNDLISRVDDQSIIVLSDANTFFEEDVITKLVRHFTDDEVGAVCGELCLVDGESKENKDGLYWRYERLLKFHEGRIGGLLGANGANYAIRRNLYDPLPIDTIVDDFTIVMNVALKGYKVKYDAEAIAIEEVAPDVSSEFGRRVRIGAGNYQAFMRYAKFLFPRPSTLYFSYLSHKVLRWFVPHLMLLAIVTNAALMEQAFYLYLFGAQIGFYLFVLLTYLLKNRLSLPGIVMFPLFIVAMNIALGAGFLRFIRGKSRGTWSRTAR